MAQTTRKRKETTYQAVLSDKRILGSDFTADALTVQEGAVVSVLNADIFANPDGDFLQSRNGFTYLKKASGANYA